MVAAPRVSAAATVTVPGNYATIQQAMNSVPDGSTINVAAGTYAENLFLLNTTRSFTVRGVAGSTIVDAHGAGAGVQVIGATGHIVFVGLTFRNGTRDSGGGFLIQNSSPAFFNCIFESNTGYDGAGGALFNSNATFTGCTIRNNYARHFGGGVYIVQGSHPVFTGCDILTNHSGTGGNGGGGNNGAGGGVFSNDSSPTFRTSHINGNTSMFASGGIHHQGIYGSANGRAMLLVEDTEVADNVTTQFGPTDNPAEGGGIHVEDYATGTLTRARILRNIAGTGGGLNMYRGQYDVTDSIIDSNQSKRTATGGFGAGIASTSNFATAAMPGSIVNLTRTLVRNNVALAVDGSLTGTAGGIAVLGDNFSAIRSTLVLTGSVVDNNQSANQGGGILVSQTDLTVTNSLVIRNTVSGGSLPFGGGILIATTSTATISGSAIAHNTASGGSGFGGGIFMDGGVNIQMSTSQVYDNTASSRGGGIFVGGSGGGQTGTIQTSTIADNNLGSTATGQINQDACSTINYTNNVITPLSGSSLFSGCLPGTRATGTTSTVPRFSRFLAVGTGMSTTLAWSVARATTVIVAGVGTFTSPTNSPTGTVDVTPASSTTYSLTATATSPNGGNYTATTAAVNVVLPAPPPFPPPSGHTVDGDFDGDGKADITVFRPSTGIWYVRNIVTGLYDFYQWGLAGDIPVPGDYDGDGKADIAVYRPSTGIWYIRNSSDGTRRFYSGG